MFIVRVILWTACLFLQYTPEVPGLDFVTEKLPDGLVCNYAFVVGVAYFIYYLLIELPGIVGPLAAGLMVITIKTTAEMKNLNPDAYKMAAVVHAIAWILQFVGHGVFEKRAPALFDNLLQAFVMAPLFVLMEVFFMFGYKPQFHSRISEIVKVNKKLFAEQIAGGQKKST
jgi:2-hydroxy fatty acid dioxygenase